MKRRRPAGSSESAAIAPDHDLDALYTFPHNNRMTLVIVVRIFDLRHVRFIAASESNCGPPTANRQSANRPRRLLTALWIVFVMCAPINRG